MTTGQDDSRRGGGKADLLASLPGNSPAPAIDPAGFEELRTAVLEIREQVAGLRKDAQAGRPEPVTREALEAWGEDLLKRLGEAVPNGAGSNGAVAAIADHAGKMAAAAAGVDGGLERTADRFAAEVKGMEAWLAEDRSTIRAGISGIESGVGRIEADFRKYRENVSGYYLSRTDWQLNELRSMVKKLNFNWRIFLSPWAAFCVVTGMVFERSHEILVRLL